MVDAPPAKTEAATFRAFLRSELRARRWSQRHLALRAGVNPATISSLLRSERIPTLETARRLAQALLGSDVGVVPVRLVTGDPVARVAGALKADPLLDPREVAAVLRFYTDVRLPSDPTRDPDPRP